MEDNAPRRFRKFLFWIMTKHGINEGDVMHEKCLICMIFRRIEYRQYKIAHKGFWAIPENERPYEC